MPAGAAHWAMTLMLSSSLIAVLACARRQAQGRQTGEARGNGEANDRVRLRCRDLCCSAQHFHTKSARASTAARGNEEVDESTALSGEAQAGRASKAPMHAPHAQAQCIIDMLRGRIMT